MKDIVRVAFGLIRSPSLARLRGDVRHSGLTPLQYHSHVERHPRAVPREPDAGPRHRRTARGRTTESASAGTRGARRRLRIHCEGAENDVASAVPLMVPFHSAGELAHVPFTPLEACVRFSNTARGW